MTFHSNYMTVDSSCCDCRNGADFRPCLKNGTRDMIYPARGTLGIIYQLYLLLFG